MDELERAILCGIDPNETNEAKSQAAHLCEQFINTPEPWKYSIQKIFTSDNIAVKFFCLNTIQIFLQQRYSKLSEQDKLLLREGLLKYINTYIPEHPDESSAIKGKYAQVLVTFFRFEYPTHWPTFFHDLSAHLNKGPAVIETYLLILDTIDELVVSHDFDRSEINRLQNTAIKDYMRQDCVVKLATTWFDILTHLQSHTRICKLALQNISRYVSWIDINLIVNDQFIGLIFGLLSNESLRGGAAKCLEQIVSKGMDYKSKQDLLIKLRLQEIIPKLNDDDIDFQEELAKLINVIGLESIACRSDAHKNNSAPEIIQSGEALVEASLKIASQFLAHEYDDVSQSVIEFIQTYLYKLRHTKQLSDQQIGVLSTLLQIMTSKLKYDRDYNFDHEDDEEIQFQDYRKELEKLIKNILRLSPSLGYNYIKTLIYQTIIEGDCSLKPMEDVEVALRIFYISVEALIDKSNDVFFSDIINSIITSRVLSHEHPMVSLLLLELIVRYAQSIKDSEQYTTTLLMFFLGDKGIRHRNARIRGRACYLFFRFLTSFKNRHLPFTKQIIESITPLLKKDINERAQPLLDDDQLHIFELAGFLAYSVHTDPPLHKYIIDVIIMELFKVIQTILRGELYKLDTAENPQYSTYLSRSITAIATFSKSFKTCTTEISPYFQSALDFVLEAWRVVSNNFSDLRSKIMFFLHRMVECLEKKIFPFLPNILEVVVQSNYFVDLLAAVRLINQLISRFKAEIGVIIEKILVPVVKRILAMIETLDDLSEKRELIRIYLLFLQNIVLHKLTFTLTSDQNKPHTLFILNTIIESCRAELDCNLKNVKLSITILGDISNEWVGKLPGYDIYFLTSILPLFFFILSKLNFNDAESFQIACSICSLIRKFAKLIGGPFLEHSSLILNNFFRADLSSSFISLLTSSSDDKSFSSSVVELFKLRSNVA